MSIRILIDGKLYDTIDIAHEDLTNVTRLMLVDDDGNVIGTYEFNPAEDL